MFGERTEPQDKGAMENLNKKLTLNEIPEGTEELTTWICRGRAIWREETASSKALRWEHALVCLQNYNMSMLLEQSLQSREKGMGKVGMLFKTTLSRALQVPVRILALPLSEKGSSWWVLNPTT